MSEYNVICGDCREVMRGMPESRIDAIVTDPPYGLGFMGKDWDSPGGIGDFPMRRTTEANTVNTGVSRQGGRQRSTVDFAKRQANDARMFQEWAQEWAADCLRVAKPGAHLLAFGGTRMYHRLACAIEDAGWEIRDCIMWVYSQGFPKSHNLDGEWDGWGTALKPSYEPLIVARKSLDGTVAANMAKHRTGAMNIDGCRVLATDAAYKANCSGDRGHADNRSRVMDFGMGCGTANELGRWPANMIHDGSDEVMAAFPEAPGQQRSVGPEFGSKTSVNTYGDYGPRQNFAPRGDAGSAARFYYCAKASRADRNDGAENGHPTVKPTDLMRYLCRLVTPPKGTILDPFAGSGSTGRGAVAEGFNFVGIELDPAYVEIAKARIAAAKPESLFA